MARNPEAILIEAGLWAGVNGNVQAINTSLEAVGNAATAASVEAIEALATGGVPAAVDVLSSALGRVLDLVVESQAPLLELVTTCRERIDTLRVEAAEARAELDAGA